MSEAELRAAYGELLRDYFGSRMYVIYETSTNIRADIRRLHERCVTLARRAEVDPPTLPDYIADEDDDS